MCKQAVEFLVNDAIERILVGRKLLTHKGERDHQFAVVLRGRWPREAHKWELAWIERATRSRIIRWDLPDAMIAKGGVGNVGTGSTGKMAGGTVILARKAVHQRQGTRR